MRPRDPAHPNGVDVVYWIAPENGAKKATTPHVFHICQGVSPLNGKTVNHGSVTEAYAENATRITKQIPMEQKQCGFAGAKSQARPRNCVITRFYWAGCSRSCTKLLKADAYKLLLRSSALYEEQNARPASLAGCVHRGDHLRRRGHRLIVDGNDEIPPLQAPLGRIAVGIDRRDEHAAGVRRKARGAREFRG